MNEVVVIRSLDILDEATLDVRTIEEIPAELAKEMVELAIPEGLKDGLCTDAYVVIEKEVRVSFFFLLFLFFKY